MNADKRSMLLQKDFRSDSDSDLDDSEDSGDIAMVSNESDSDVDESVEQPPAAMDEETDDDVDDEVIMAIRAEKNKKREQPPKIKHDDFIVDISFHPSRDLIAIATIMGDVLIYEYTNEENNLIDTHELHLKACRAVEFNSEGTIMYSTSKDKSIMAVDMTTGNLTSSYDKAHEDPIYCLKSLDKDKIVTGDDGGTVKLWDTRKPNPVFSINIGEEYVADMITNEAEKYLVCAGGDGILTTIDLKSSKIYTKSESYDSELTCMGLFRTDTKLLVGSTKGKLYIFNWKQFGLHCDEYIGEKHSISCMVPITENIVVTAGEDCTLRASHMFPQKQLGIVGQHNLPVERLDISHDGQFIASSSVDNDVKFWNISYFENIENLIEIDHKQNKKQDMKKNLPSSNFNNASDFYSGLM